ncbi:MAG: TonB-dependent receptor, partial [Edaphobacter sp.]
VGTFGKHNEAVLEGNPITQAGHDACLALLACSGTPTKSNNRNIQNYIYQSHTQYGYADVPNGGVNDFASMALVSSVSSSNYNSLQLSVDKGLTHGLQTQVSYTYSHSLDDGSSFEGTGFGGSRGFNQFPGGKSLNYGNSAFDARQRFTMGTIYVVPKRGGNAYSPMNLLLSGWQVSGIVTFATGFPYDVSYGGGTSLSLWCSANTSFYACPDVPNQVAPLVRTDPRTYTGTGTNKTRWFQKSSFGAEAVGQFGNVSRYKYHGAGINNTNLILAKNFALSGDGTRSLQLRMESDNAFNHTQFTNPNGSFTSTNFGLITSAAAGRQTQLAAKIYF